MRMEDKRMIGMQRRDPVMLAWVLGLALAAAVYLVGPNRFLFRVLDTLHMIAWRLGEFVADLSILAVVLVRALAIGLYATFVVLAVAVARRGGRARGALVVVSLVFLALVNHGIDPFGGPAGGNARWTAALILSGSSAAVMTGRLRPGPPAPARP